MFFDNLKEACFKNGTSPTALLKSLGMSTSSVTAWKKGVEPSVGTVYRLAEKLGVDPATLLEGWTESRLDDYNAGYVDCMEDDWEQESKKAPTLVPKDERKVARNENEEDMLLLARHMEPIPEEDRKILKDQFKNSIDLYLKARGLNTQEDK